MSVINCGPCGLKKDPEEDWVDHLVRKSHVRRSRRHFDSVGWSDKEAERSLLVYANFPLVSSRKEADGTRVHVQDTDRLTALLKKCGGGSGRGIKDFLAWPEKPFMAFIQFVGLATLETGLMSLKCEESGRNFVLRLDDHQILTGRILSQVSKAELNIILPLKRHKTAAVGNASEALAEEADDLPILQHLEERDPVSKVFSIHLLRDMIFDYAIHNDKNGKVDRSTVCSIRSVCRHWDDSVLQLLKRNGDYFLTIRLKFPSTGTQIEEGCHAKLLDDFMSTFHPSSQIDRRTPTYKLVIHIKAFLGNVSSLRNFFRQCHAGLVTLDLTLPINLELMNELQDIPLTSLRKLKCHFRGRIFYSNQNSDGDEARSNVANFLQIILSGVTAMKMLRVIGWSDTDLESILTEIIIPSTIKKVILSTLISSRDVELILVNSNLPKLSSLTLTVCCNMGQILRSEILHVLDKFRGSLNHLNLECSDSGTFSGTGNNPINFPIMIKLQTLKTDCSHWSLEPGISMERHFPALRTVELYNQTDSTFGKWISDSTFSTVVQLAIAIRKGEVLLKFDSDTMTLIHVAFPNVVRLELRLEKTDASGIQYIFNHMTSLVDLELVVNRSYPRDFQHHYGQPSNSIFWDSLLIGASTQLTSKMLRLKDRSNLELPNQHPSIRQLKELRTLTLLNPLTHYGYEYDNDYEYDIRHHYYEEGFSWLTDLPFQLAFLEMPRLEKLIFSGQFDVAGYKVVEDWNTQGRICTYTNDSDEDSDEEM